MILNRKLEGLTGLEEELKEQTETIKKAKVQSDDGNPEVGRQDKESVIEGCNYTIGYITAVKSLLPEFVDLLKKSESDS